MPQRLADYLALRTGQGATSASLARYKASLARARRLFRFDDPTKDALVTYAMKRVRRSLGVR